MVHLPNFSNIFGLLNVLTNVILLGSVFTNATSAAVSDFSKL